ncbi:fumarylacetoacetate hydrolase family protein [Paenirhodobacter hankyongi]|uniref:FAA hydrolase family protein n=1 Tax=Paenirhodobacter hankyongi TaxID=2294033 RepID=A0A421BQN9_9RHOB|nr:fumarylacetoacetate hydrolase family protein [Sinirhodobacter hankyongi]RLL65281.1 FAA hydrolase family protein [Sinirhodobacter hankyongi]
MRFLAFEAQGAKGLAVAEGEGTYHGLTETDPAFPGDLEALIRAGLPPAAIAALQAGPEIDPAAVRVALPLRRPGKILCVGLNYAAHAKESGHEIPKVPTVFGRFASGLIASGEGLVRPRVSELFDYEAELAVVIGKAGRDIPKERALEHVAGYTIFNDGSVRDWQLATPQWTVGKNFDGTGALGPVLVTPDELPPGASGLHLQLRLNGEVLQDTKTDDLIFGVADLIAFLSTAMTLEPGDIIATGTPSGVGGARKPQVWLQPGDICEVEIEGIGILSNPVVQQE